MVKLFSIGTPVFLCFFLLSVDVLGQSEKVGNVWQIATGFNQSLFPETILGNGEIEGSAGCSVGVLYQMESELTNQRKLRHFHNLGAFYEFTNFQLRDLDDQTSIPLINLHIASIYGWQGLSLYLRNQKMNVYAKAGLRFQYVFSVNEQASDLLQEEVVNTELFAAGASTGMRYNRTALEVEYFKDLNQVFESISEINAQIAVRIVYYFL